MPELPEVEAFKEYIAHTSFRKKIQDVTATDKTLIKGGFLKLKKALVGRKFITAQRRGKYVILSVSNTDKKVVMHFGLTGSIDYRKDAEHKPSYARVTFSFENGAALFFIDARKFGKIWLVDTTDQIPALKTMGKDALAVTEKQFKDILAERQRKNIKALLMDQDAVAGIGNEYSDEILFQAGIDPHNNVQDLSAAQIKKLYTNIHKVLKYALNIRKKQMSKIGDATAYSNLANQDFATTYLQAHRHTDHKCPKNKSHVLKIAKVAGRTAYYCPRDQK